MILHRTWNRGRNGLHQLGQPIAPSILFPVFHPPYPQGTLNISAKCGKGGRGAKIPTFCRRHMCMLINGEGDRERGSL